MKTIPLRALTKIISQNSAVLSQNVPLISFFGSSVIATKFQSFVLPELLSQAAWTIFLQSSLILSIWSNFNKLRIPRFKVSTLDNHRNATTPQSTTSSSLSKSANIKMFLTFISGSIGSCLGSYVGYLLSIFYLKYRYLSVANIPFEMILQLKMIASCLTASYIGGTANFFETKQVLSNSIFSSSTLDNMGIDGSSRMASLKFQISQSLTAVAGVDILVMIAYFSLLTFIQRNSMSLNEKQRFQKNPNTFTSTENKLVHDFIQSYSEEKTNQTLSTHSVDIDCNKSVSIITRSFQDRFFQYLVPLITSITICRLSSTLQSFSPIPGVSVICSLIISLSVAQGLITVMEGMRKGPCLDVSSVTNNNVDNSITDDCPMIETSEISSSFITHMKRSCQVLSEVMLVLFYVLIGLTSKLTDLLKVGTPTLILVITSLSTHLLFMLTVARLWNNIIKSSSWFIDTDTIVIASNACIGGSSTAASVASTLRRSDLILPATMVGIFGYLIGTPIGLFVANRLNLEPHLIFKLFIVSRK